MNYSTLLFLLSLVSLSLFSSNMSAQPDFKPNYDENKVPAYTLPNPLVFENGDAVKNQADWQQRRTEILQLFSSQVYGKTPSQSLDLRTKTLSTNQKVLGGKATRKEVRVFFTEQGTRPYMDILLFVPNGNNRPAPAFLGLNFYGNHTIHPDSSITLSDQWMRANEDFGIVDHRATEASRGVRVPRWPVETIIDRGYALATVYCGDIDPDKNDFQDGVHPIFYQANQQEPTNDEWGTIGAWAWGLSRALDHLQTEDAVNGDQIAVIGHSRLGKAALWAGAQDKRFAMVISNNSGCGGAALSRRAYGETVGRINHAFPHWFCDNFEQYNKNESSLPVDQHMLLALIAPRPLYVASAEEDEWADPKGEFLSAAHATPVYELLGKSGLPTTKFPPVDQPVTGTIGYHIRSGGHDINSYDWQQYLNFADQHFTTESP
ncbi:alpha/beta hydrolase family protein [Tunicatimonas pelagia]|uniref:alpha/beta hydrolase family protein n=1 Tax=Tunicatimonas pelagia TaxID=931531 RepID=UPI0026655B13|nr:acetylxylan esterase [Tunicatimonas pelagia]WKN42562.1 acetylxylan esterase [Tunicatimonas pelagia]